MCVNVSHLVLEALGDTDDQVVDDCSDGTESGDVLADTVVDLDGNGVLCGLGEADGNVRQVLDQLATGALNGDLASLDVHLDCTRSKLPSAYQYNTNADFNSRMPWFACQSSQTISSSSIGAS